MCKFYLSKIHSAFVLQQVKNIRLIVKYIGVKFKII